MKVIKNPVTLVSAALLMQACGSTPPPPEVPIVEVSSATLEKPESIQVQTFMMRGTMVVDNDSRTLMPCGSQAPVWLDLTPQLTNPVMALAERPSQPMYAEVIGYLQPSPSHGPASEYQASFVVEQINYATLNTSSGCKTPVKTTRAFGNEPFWNAEFLSSDEIKLSQLGTPDKNTAINPLRLEPDRRQYRFDEGEITMTQGFCFDSMGHAFYGWHSLITRGEQEFIGCATTASTDLSVAKWQGFYFSEANTQRDFSVEMTISPDHSAQTKYFYDGEEATVESGYWQQLNPNQIQVVMTRHQDKRLVTERVFTRSGSELVATHEKVGRTVYPIANGGLSLFPANKPISIADQPTGEILETSVSLAPASIPSSNRYVEQVNQAVKNYFVMHRTKPNGNKYRWLTYDLNGDNKDELLVMLDWCNNNGCTLLVFENHNDNWRFNSRITEVSQPVKLGKEQYRGWQDMLLPTGNDYRQLRYEYISYPLSAQSSPKVSPYMASDVILFSDAVSPAAQGVTLQ